MVGMAGGLLALATLGVLIVAAASLGHWLLGPVNRAAGHLNAPTRFLLTDFIWLMIHLQVMLGVALTLLRESTPHGGLLDILACLSLPVLVLWAASVSVVSRAGITHPLRRAIVILVLVPGALGEIMAAPILLVAGLVAITAGPGTWFLPLPNDDVTSRFLIVGMATVGAVIGAVIVRRLSFWVVAAPATNRSSA